LRAFSVSLFSGVKRERVGKDINIGNKIQKPIKLVDSCLHRNDREKDFKEGKNLNIRKF